MDVFAGVCVLIVGWTGYRLGVATERDRAAARAAERAERIAAREAAIREHIARKAAAAPNVIHLNNRRSAS